MPVWVIALIPIAFLIVFPLFWCFVLWINSLLSGWRRLARRYQAKEQPAGKEWRSVQGRIGFVSYKNSLRCFASGDGLFLQPEVLFRFAHPLLFIPWKDMKEVQLQRVLWITYVRAKVGDPVVGSFALDSKVFEQSAGNCLLASGDTVHD